MEACGATTRQRRHCECPGCRENRQIEVPFRTCARDRRSAHAALAVTTYSNIIDNAPFFTRLAADDQGYISAARQEEMSHYNLEASVTHKQSPFTTFYFPKKMFDDAQTTLNTLVTLEDAFIAAYLVGVRRFSTADLRVTAARIMGIESDHRTLARVVAPGVATQDGGPVENVTGIQGKITSAKLQLQFAKAKESEGRFAEAAAAYETAGGPCSA